MPALWQQGRGAALVRLFRNHGEKERLTRHPLASQEVHMAYYKLLIQIWCDWDPSNSDLEEIGRQVVLGNAIFTLREIVTFADRPQDIEDEVAMRFFGGEERRPEPGLNAIRGEISHAFRQIFVRLSPNRWQHVSQ
jgi:hypothetical protein